MKYLRSLMQQFVTACKNQAKLIQQFTLSLLYLFIIHIVALLFFFLFRLVLFTSIDYQFPPDIQNNFLMQATAFIKGLWFDNVIACYILLLPLVILWITALCNYHSKWVFRFIEVSARTVSRWETGTNLPDLSILVELAEYYDVEMRELLDGERSQTMNKEMKETLDKVAVYEEWAKRKALKAGNLAFASMFMIGVVAIIIQMLLTVDIRFVLGETISVLAGGILYAAIMVYNGIWDKCLPKRATIWRDFLTSVICAGIFSVIYGVCLLKMGATETQITRLTLEFLIGITIVAFIVLRILAFINRKKNQKSANDQDEKETLLSKMEYIKIYNAQNIVETEQIMEMLKQNGIVAFSQESGANVAMHGAPGFGIYGVDIFVKTDDAEKAAGVIKEINNQENE